MTEKVKVVNYYQQLSKTYERRRLATEKSKIISDLQNNWFVKNLANTGTTISLEIGCGTGRLTSKLMKNTRVLIATDASTEMIKINRKKTNQHSLENEIHYMICDTAYLPFRDKTFNNIVGARVFWHLTDYQQALKETLRVLNAGGSLLFDFPCLWGPLSLYSKLRKIKHDVLMLFIDESTIRKIFKGTKNLTIHGNTSAFLFFIPDKLLKIKPIKKIIFLLEIMDKALLKNWLYSYYLIKVTK